jgi:hypothetical protein
MRNRTTATTRADAIRPRHAAAAAKEKGNILEQRRRTISYLRRSSASTIVTLQ